MKHAYIGRKPCGCCVEVVTDNSDAETGKVVGNMIADGLTVERVTWPRYREIAREPTFMNCPHGQLPLPIPAD